MLLDAINYCLVTEDSESDFQDSRSFSSTEQANSVGSSCSNIRQASAGGSSISTEEGSAGSSQHGPNTCGKRKLSDRGKVQVNAGFRAYPTSSLCFHCGNL